MFSEGLDASIKPMVSQYRQGSRDVSFLRFVNYAKAHGSAGRSRERTTNNITIQTPASLRMGANRKVGAPSRKIRSAAHLAESSYGSEERSYPSREGTGYGNAFIAEGDFIGTSDEIGYGGDGSGGASTVPTHMYTESSNTEATDPVLAFRGRGHTPPPRIPMEDKGTAFRRLG